MRFSFTTSPFATLITVLLCLTSSSTAEYLIESKSLNPCMANSNFSATLFNVVFTPANRSLAFNIVGVSEISGNVTAQIKAFVYGWPALNMKVDPCSSPDLKGFCPMNTGQINIESNFLVDQSTVNSIPSVAFTVPDIDGRVQVYINDTITGKALACVEAELSNGKTVYQKAVGWTTAVIAGLGLVASAVTSGLGHSNTAAHVAANAMSLFGFFQAQAFIGMTAVELPPIVASWTQNFQWSMGIIRVGFLQTLATWYQRSTGGTPSKLLSTLSTTSVDVQRRMVKFLAKRQVYEHSLRLAKRMWHKALAKRSNNMETQGETTSVITIHGIERVGFRANMEATNIFMTGYIFFIIFVIFVILGVCIFKGICEALVKAGRMKGNKFQDFRNGWLTVLKGIMFRIILIGFPQMVVLCFWELTVRDSAGEVALAIFTIVTMVCVLGWAASKVIRIAQRSITMHKNPAYILYSDPVSLNKWGFLYVQFKATAYFFVVPVLLYILLKGMFVGLGQGSAVTQAIALVLLEAAFLIGISILRPYMDKKTNAFNIAIAAVNFVSAIFLLVFSNIFNQPAVVSGVMGVIFFVLNVIFAFVLLCLVLWASIAALISKNPDTRYQPMRDDRGSFIKSQTQLNTELDALGATARGEPKPGQGPYKTRSALDDDEDSFSSAEHAHPKGTEPPRSPVETSMFIPGDNGTRHQPPSYYSRNSDQSAVSHSQQGYAPSYNGSQQQYRQNNNASPWQRGAGYEH